MNRFLAGFLVLLAISFGIFLFMPKGNLKGNDNNIVRHEKAVAPKEVIGIYLTSWSAADPGMVDYVIGLSERTKVNTVVIDIKDWSGHVPYDTDVPEAEKSERVIIKDMPGLVKKLHDSGLYVIARVAVFQDPVLASERSDLAVKSKSGGIWCDFKGLSWIDPSQKEYWKYIVDLSKDALGKGFDEINFDYIRFPSDGILKDMDLDIPSEREVIAVFFKYLRESIPDDNISVDLFGLSTVNKDDLGIGQSIEDAYQYFDFVCPMVYPSHYASGFIGLDNPAEHPFEVVGYSMARAKMRLGDFQSKLRPWLQDFNMGAVYDTEKVLLQISAVREILGDDYSGYMLWNPENWYNEEALSEGN
ncbi:MAG: putative glycoside hydrolase [Candidatus Paceibacterota bacterium]